MGSDTPAAAISKSPDGSEKLANDKNLQAATVEFLDSTSHVFYVPKKAEGFELFDKVASHINLNEKEYFALSYDDTNGQRHWLRDSKRIAKQLKGHPWQFNFEVKFYPPDPSSLTDDSARYQLYLQVRNDIFTGRLPATIASHALLGSYVAQSERGDCNPSPAYDDYLKRSRIAPVITDALIEKTAEHHKQHRGEMPAEAQAHYLDNAAKLNMYGVIVFPAKDGKGTPVQIGVCAHGINIYRDQMRVHRFLWQNIVKIAYRRNIFTIKLRPGELEKNETTIAFKLADHSFAKRVWKCAVEHHTFFRLIQPEEKPKKGLFRWHSARFRYQGRTQFQTKMASQTFERPSPAVGVQRSQSLKEENIKTGPLETNQNKSMTLEHTGGRPSHEQDGSPEKTYTLERNTHTEMKETSWKTVGTEVNRKVTREKKKRIKGAKGADASGNDSLSSSDSETGFVKHGAVPPGAANLKEPAAVGDVLQLSYNELVPCDFCAESGALPKSPEAPTQPVTAQKVSPAAGEKLPKVVEGREAITIDSLAKTKEYETDVLGSLPRNVQQKAEVTTTTTKATVTGSPATTTVTETRVLGSPTKTATVTEAHVIGSPTQITANMRSQIDGPDDKTTASADEPKLQQTAVQSWHEVAPSTESTVTEVDEHGNVLRKTVKTQQVKHTTQRQTYSAYPVKTGEEQPAMHTVGLSRDIITPLHQTVDSTKPTSPIVETKQHMVAYEAGTEVPHSTVRSTAEFPSELGELISSRTITTGNRTIETITYKTEKDGIVETHVEHRVTILSGDNIDHDAELSQAILEATKMNPDMTVEKIEVKQETQC